VDHKAQVVEMQYGSNDDDEFGEYFEDDGLD